VRRRRSVVPKRVDNDDDDDDVIEMMSRRQSRGGRWRWRSRRQGRPGEHDRHCGCCGYGPGGGCAQGAAERVHAPPPAECAVQTGGRAGGPSMPPPRRRHRRRRRRRRRRRCCRPCCRLRRTMGRLGAWQLMPCFRNVDRVSHKRRNTRTSLAGRSLTRTLIRARAVRQVCYTPGASGRCGGQCRGHVRCLRAPATLGRLHNMTLAGTLARVETEGTSVRLIDAACIHSLHVQLCVHSWDILRRAAFRRKPRPQIRRERDHDLFGLVKATGGREVCRSLDHFLGWMRANQIELPKHTGNATNKPPQRACAGAEILARMHDGPSVCQICTQAGDSQRCFLMPAD
jgi:hypothetical protein